MVRLLLAPHLPCQENHDNITAGRTPSGVSERGRELARHLSLDDEQRTRIAAIVHSGLPRSVETIELCFADAGIPIVVDERLSAIDYGELQGRSMEEIDRVRLDHIEVPFPGGESYRQMAERHRSLLADLDRRYPDRDVLLIAHNGTLPILLHIGLSLPLESAFVMAKSLADPMRQGSAETFYANAPYGPWPYAPSPEEPALECRASEEERVVVVAQHKSGTNLIRKLLEALDLPPIGLGIRESYSAVGAKLEKRFGSKLAFLDPAKLFSVLTGDFQGRRSLFFHSLPDGPFIRDWLQCGGRVIFHYRDPRAVVVSLVHYLSDDQVRAQIPEEWGARHHAAEIARCTDIGDKVRHVLEQMPEYLEVYRKHTWLLDHPGVCRTRFEDLVGTRGGGSKHAQRVSLETVMAYLGAEVPLSTDLAEGLFDEGARTFRRGRIDSWRHELPSDVLARLESSCGDILERYGYREGVHPRARS
ncbi:MAG: histidine phosphatase family protein [Planctomycetota bacterium]